MVDSINRKAVEKRNGTEDGRQKGEEFRDRKEKKEKMAK